MIQSNRSSSSTPIYAGACNFNGRNGCKWNSNTCHVCWKVQTKCTDHKNLRAMLGVSIASHRMHLGEIKCLSRERKSWKASVPRWCGTRAWPKMQRSWNGDLKRRLYASAMCVTGAQINISSSFWEWPEMLCDISHDLLIASINLIIAGISIIYFFALFIEMRMHTIRETIISGLVLHDFK